MTREKLIKILEEEGIDIDQFAYGDYEPIPELGNFVEVASVGGEDQGSLWYKVYFYGKLELYIKITGTYTSHNGTDFYDGYDAITFVTPKNKTIIIYE